jgi:YesN/AraC family two-component response regulator
MKTQKFGKFGWQPESLGSLNDKTFLITGAKHILLKPNKTISEVAYQLGFEYSQYFSRSFKKKEGLCPTTFREKYKLN